MTEHSGSQAAKQQFTNEGGGVTFLIQQDIITVVTAFHVLINYDAMHCRIAILVTKVSQMGIWVLFDAF